MDRLMGLLRLRVRRGINLAVRDTRSSDPYVVITMGEQKLKTGVVKNNCNPEWNEELTLCVADPDVPVKMIVHDKDTFTVDDKMGEAEIDLKPYLECVKKHVDVQPTGTVISRIQQNRKNCLAQESCIVWNNGKLVQDMCLQLKNVECGEVEVQLEWINVPGSKGL
ncbi:protein C2-DOMAIN ABA-RELATED 7-like [Malania oleifera]|uniref:protein C2-DOMAIN ABA-RELATED 7-like n=1 Tax=Malania oleifera TaxID=397392 RepID=UPI0025AECCFA|nr:protein C2-DOMAIN ABA-RELATED 7-like [Malania oleifera]XP_057962792.1 protein C2-DOMAIN ABA-RELATED 7-like [Malania oleifera]